MYHEGYRQMWEKTWKRRIMKFRRAQPRKHSRFQSHFSQGNDMGVNRFSLLWSAKLTVIRYLSVQTIQSILRRYIQCKLQCTESKACTYAFWSRLHQAATSMDLSSDNQWGIVNGEWCSPNLSWKRWHCLTFFLFSNTHTVHNVVHTSNNEDRLMWSVHVHSDSQFEYIFVWHPYKNPWLAGNHSWIQTHIHCYRHQSNIIFPKTRNNHWLYFRHGYKYRCMQM